MISNERMVNPFEAVAFMREKHKRLSRRMTDADAYSLFKDRYKNLDYPDDNPFEVKIPKTRDLNFKSWDDSQSWYGKLALGNPTEWLTDDYDFFKKSYNESMAGAMYEIMHGKPKYDIKNMEENDAWYEDVGQFFVGLLNPLDALTFMGTSAVGSLAWKAGGKYMLSKGAQTTVSNMIKNQGIKYTVKNAPKAHMINVMAKKGMVESGIGLGTLGASGAALHDAAMQRSQIREGGYYNEEGEWIEKKDFDWKQFTGATAKAGTTSAISGAALGWFVKGSMAGRFAEAQRVNALNTKVGNIIKDTGKFSGFNNAVTRAATNPASQLAVEAGIFTTGGIPEQFIESSIKGEDFELTIDNLLTSYFTNLGIVGGFKAAGAAWSGIRNKRNGVKGKSALEIYTDQRSKYISDNILPEYRKFKAYEQYQKNPVGNKFEAAGEFQDYITRNKTTGEIEPFNPETVEMKAKIHLAEKLRAKGMHKEAEEVMLDVNETMEKSVTELQDNQAVAKIQKRFDELIAKDELSVEEQGWLMRNWAVLRAFNRKALDSMRDYDNNKMTEGGVDVLGKQLFGKEWKGADVKYKVKEVEKTGREWAEESWNERNEQIELLDEAMSSAGFDGSKESVKNDILAKHTKVEIEQGKDGKYYLKLKDIFGRDQDVTQVKKSYRKGYDTEKEAELHRAEFENEVKREINGVDVDGKIPIIRYSKLINPATKKPYETRDWVEEKDLANIGKEGTDYVRLDKEGPNNTVGSNTNTTGDPVYAALQQMIANVQQTVDILIRQDPSKAGGVDAKTFERAKRIAAEISNKTLDEIETTFGKNSDQYKAKEKLINNKFETATLEEILDSIKDENVRAAVIHVLGRTSETPERAKSFLKLAAYLESIGKSMTEMSEADYDTYLFKGHKSIKHNVKIWNKTTKKYDDKIITISGRDGISPTLTSNLNKFMSKAGKRIFGYDLQDIIRDKNEIAQQIMNSIDRSLKNFDSKTFKETYTKTINDIIGKITDKVKQTTYRISRNLGLLGLRDSELNKMDLKYLKDTNNWQQMTTSDGKYTGWLLRIVGSSKPGDFNISKNKKTRYIAVSNDTYFEIQKLTSEPKFSSITKSINQTLKDKIGVTSTVGNKTVKYNTPFNLMRHWYETSAETGGLGGQGSAFVSSMLGHGKDMVSKFYKKVTPQDIFDNQIKMHEDLQTGIFDGKKFMRMKKGEISSSEALVNEVMRFRETYGDALTVDLVNELRAKGIPEDAVAYYEADRIRIMRNKAPAYAVGHEYAHASFAVNEIFMKLSKEGRLPAKLNKKVYKMAQDLFNESRKLFVDKNGKFDEEMAVKDYIEPYFRGMLEAPVRTKIKKWFYKFNRMWKTLFNAKYTKAEMGWALGELVETGTGIPLKELARHLPGKQGKKFMRLEEFDSPSDFTKTIDNQIKFAAAKHGLKVRELKTMIAKAAGIESPEAFRTSLLGDYTPKEVSALENFASTMKELDIGKMSTSKAFDRKIALRTTIRAYEVDKGITKDKQIRYFKSIGVKDGDISYSMIGELTEYKRFLAQLKPERNIAMEHVMNQEINNFLSMKTSGNRWQRLLDYTNNNFLWGEQFRYIEHLGLKTISERLFTHDAIQTHHKGPFQVFEHFSKKALGGSWDVLGTKGASKWEGSTGGRRIGIKDLLFSFDHEIILEDIYRWKNSGKISKKDVKIITEAEKFLRKVVKDEWWQKVDRANFKAPDIMEKTTKYISNDKTRTISKEAYSKLSDTQKADYKKHHDYKWLRKEAIGPNKEAILTPEARIAESYDAMMRRYATIYSEAHHQVMNEAQWIEYKKTDKFKAVKDMMYVHRSVTEDGKIMLGVSGSETMRKNIEKITAELSIKEAKRIYKEEYEKASDDAKQDMIYGEGKYKRQDTPHDIAKSKAEQEYLDRIEFSPDKMSISAVKARLEKQDNYMENSEGNFKRVYETNYDKTTVKYTHSMAKFAANVEIMPEIVLKGETSFEGTTLGEMLTKIQVGATGKTKVLSDYVVEVVNKQMGIGGEKVSMYEPVFKTSEALARTAAKLGLSFPTAGVKNIGTGTAGSLGAFRVSEFAKGVFDVIKGEEKLQREFLETAATETGVSIYEPTGMEGKFERYLLKTFKNFQKHIENTKMLNIGLRVSIN